MTRTNEKISKSISKKSYALSIKNDADRKNPRHGLACEYLFEVLREKQFYKEMEWLCINLRKAYKKEIIPLIKQKIKDIRDLDKENNLNKIEKQSIRNELSNIELKDKWELILSKLELPSTKMLLSDQAELKSYDSEKITIAISPNWENMIKTRKLIIENALKKIFGEQVILNLVRNANKSNLINTLEVTQKHDLISKYKNNLKLIFKCRSKIFKLLNTVELGLKTKNSIFLINLQKNIYNKIIIPSHCIEKPINSISMSGNRTNTIVAFADVFIPYSGLDLVQIKVDDRGDKKFNIILNTNISKYWRNTNLKYDKYFHWDKWKKSTLGEVKIAKQESEEVLQQINFYHELVSPSRTYICLDYQDSQLLNLTKDSKIKVNCLGNKFEEFCKNRPDQKLEEI
tara:strand:- start:5 stop:1207 length:1203 start_codon:yes stop_codon:yes gene_type:complete